MAIVAKILAVIAVINKGLNSHNCSNYFNHYGFCKSYDCYGYSNC